MASPSLLKVVVGETVALRSPAARPPLPLIGHASSPAAPRLGPRPARLPRTVLAL